MIVDNNDGDRQTIRQMIATATDTVREFDSADAAVNALAGFKPDCVTVNAALPEMSAFQAIRTLRDSLPAARVICVTLYDRPGYRRAAFEAGASGFVVLKENLPDLQLLVTTKRLLLSMQM